MASVKAIDPVMKDVGCDPIQDHDDDLAHLTHAIGSKTLADISWPFENNPLTFDRITPPSSLSARIDDVASHVLPNRTPDLAFAVIQVATKREFFGSEKLKALSAQVKEQLGDIDLLLDLSGELTELPDKDSHDIPDKMKNIIAKLECHKIQVWKGGDKLSKEKISEIKAQISSQVDKLRTALQTKISTEIQPEVNNLQSIMNIVQTILQSDARLKRKTNELPR